jgi:hypothetical protein
MPQIYILLSSNYKLGAIDASNMVPSRPFQSLESRQRLLFSGPTPNPPPSVMPAGLGEGEAPGVV